MKKIISVITPLNAGICMIVAVALCAAFSANAQTTIYGKVMNAGGQPLANASILLLDPKDSSLVKGQLSNDAGAFRFENITEGKYLVSATYTGFKNECTEPFNVAAKQERMELGIIKLEKIPEQLQEVIVAAKKPLYEQKIDRLVINVAAGITFAGSNALDVLERSPGITVKRMSNSLSINGKDGVMVMINGKRVYMEISAVIQMLSSMPSGDIERFEIITTPPANFDAEGNAGVINIVLKSNNQFGTNGSYTITAGYNKGEQNSASLNINHRKGKTNLFANYSFSRNRLQQVWDNYHAVTNAGKLLENYSQDNRHAIESQNFVQAGIDYEISKKTIIGALVSANFRHWTMEALNDAFVSINHQLDTAVKIINNELHNTQYYDVNLNLQHNIKPDEKLTVNIDYLQYQDNNPNSYANAYYNSNGGFLYNENVQSSKNTPLTFWIGAIDYTKTISKKVDMEAGVKATQSGLRNEVAVNTFFTNAWVKDTSLSGNHTLDENISAAYTSFTAKLSEKISMKLGLRYEYTHSILASETGKDDITRNYGNLFPSFFMMYNIKEASSINLSYSKRIWRPSFMDLAPYVIFLDPKTFSTGNPALQPAIIDAVNAAYTLKNKMITLSYSYTTNPISQQPFIDEATNRMISAAQNSKSNQNASIILSLPFTIYKWWNMQNNLTLYWAQSNFFYKEAMQIKNKGFYFNTSQNFLLPKDFSIGLTGYYSSKSIWGLYIFQPMGSIDIGVQKKMSKKKSTLTFNISNILNSQKGKYSAIIPEQNLVIKNYYIWGYTGFSLTFTHNFGNDKVKAKRDRTTGSEDEKGRAY